MSAAKTKIKMTIELSQDEYEPIKKMADYCHTTPLRIVEALLYTANAEQYLRSPQELIWLFITEYLQEKGENSERLRSIERFVNAGSLDYYANACHQLGIKPTMEGFKLENQGQMDSLEAFVKWEQIDSPEAFQEWFRLYGLKTD